MKSEIGLILKEIRKNNSVLALFTDEDLVRLALVNLLLESRRVKENV